MTDLQKIVNDFTAQDLKGQHRSYTNKHRIELLEELTQRQEEKIENLTKFVLDMLVKQDKVNASLIEVLKVAPKSYGK